MAQRTPEEESEWRDTFRAVMHQIEALVSPIVTEDAAAHLSAKEPMRSRFRTHFRDLNALQPLYPAPFSTQSWADVIATFLRKPESVDIAHIVQICSVLSSAISYDITAGWTMALKSVATPAAGLLVLRAAYLDAALLPNGAKGREVFHNYLRERGLSNVSFMEATKLMGRYAASLAGSGVTFPPALRRYLEIEGVTYLE